MDPFSDMGTVVSERHESFGKAIGLEIGRS